MQARNELPWSDVVRQRLQLWFRWSAGNHFHMKAQNPLVAMTRRAAGELPGDDCSIPRELTPELEVTEKALGQMLISGIARNLHARDVLLDVYLHGKSFEQIESERSWSPQRREIEVWRAESIVSRFMIAVEREFHSRGIALPTKIA